MFFKNINRLLNNFSAPQRRTDVQMISCWLEQIYHGPESSQYPMQIWRNGHNKSSSFFFPSSSFCIRHSLLTNHRKMSGNLVLLKRSRGVKGDYLISIYMIWPLCNCNVRNTSAHKNIDSYWLQNSTEWLWLSRVSWTFALITCTSLVWVSLGLDMRRKVS